MKSLVSTLLVVLCTTSAGCAEYAYLELEVRNNPPTAYEVNSNRIEMYVGTSIIVFADPESSVRTDFSDNGGVVELRSQDSSVLDVRPVTGRDRFLLGGNNPGQTCLEVWVKDEFQECIPAFIRGYDE